jgi:pimeloyl-ACP methyl ester carboxylesterase
VNQIDNFRYYGANATSLKELKVPTLVIGGTHDTSVQKYHFDTLVKNISGVRGQLVERAERRLIWTHTKEFMEIIRLFLKLPK